MSKKAKTAAIRIVAGPTAGGKSAFALELAARHEGVIINADSRQVYNRLSILTAHPSTEELKSAPHELYGTLHPNEPCSAGTWQAMAAPVIEKTLTAGKTPIVVGGTGLYLKALMEGLSPMPVVPAGIRAAAVQKQAELGNPAFHAELAKRDPVSAAKFHPSHTARLVRAWEILEATGRTLAEWQATPKIAPPTHWHFTIHKIMPDREELYRRCDARFLKMLQEGALQQVRCFNDELAAGVIASDTLLKKSLGYKALTTHLEGKITLEDAIASAQTETRQYAKRQMTWFRHQL